MAVNPVAKSIILCDYHVGYQDSKVDLYGIFNAMRPANGYPYREAKFCLFSQLINGMDRVPFFVDIRRADTDGLIFTTETRELLFPNRFAMIQLALTIEGCVFPDRGLYKIELFCDNCWVCDTELQMR